jgi:stage V sporulation protein G
MEITEIRIKLMDDPSERLQAFCSITLDGCFVIRDLKIIQGTRGSFVAMPSRKLMDRCPRCSCKNHLRARFCNDCGCELHEERASKADDGRAKLYADIAHPINSECRERIQANVIVAYSLELEKAKLPGYVCTYDDFGEENYATSVEEITYTPMVPHSATTSTATVTSSTATTSRPRHTFVNRVAQLEEEGFGSGLV